MIQSLAVSGSISFSLCFAIIEASVLSDGSRSGKNASHGQMSVKAHPMTKYIHEMIQCTRLTDLNNLTLAMVIRLNLSSRQFLLLP
jgi:hypothetical protein